MYTIEKLKELLFNLSQLNNKEVRDKIINGYSGNTNIPEYIRVALKELENKTSFDFSKYFEEQFEKKVFDDKDLVDYFTKTFNSIKIGIKLWVILFILKYLNWNLI